MSIRVLAVAAVIASVFCACERAGTLPQKPQLYVDRDSIGFGTEFNEGVLIGTEPQASLLIGNEGRDTLNMTVEKTGDGAFRIEGPLSTELKAGEETFLRVFFKPTQAKAYTGTLVIKSNAENTPSKTITLSGSGVAP